MRAVLLDVGGVLVLPSHEAVREALSRIGFEPEIALVDSAQYHAMSAADEATGEAIWPEGPTGSYWAGYARALGVAEGRVPAAVDAFQAVFSPNSSNWTRPIEDSVQALGELRRAGARVALISNSQDTLEAMLRELGICQVGDGAGVDVDAIIVSAVVRLEKPDSRIFEMALEAIGAQPSEAIHVGDSVRFDVEGATGAGVEAIHFDPFSICSRHEHSHMASLHDLIEIASET